MKHKTLLLTFLFVTAFTMGCDKPAVTSQKLENFQEKSYEATRDLKDYTFAVKLIIGIHHLIFR